MRNWICVLASMLLAACSLSTSSDSSDASRDSRDPALPSALAKAGEAPSPRHSGPGDSVEYIEGSKPHRVGSATWWPVRFDARRMLAASESEGRLMLRSPSGEVLSFRHVRSEMGASGAHTWLGRSESGDTHGQALLVFGRGHVVGRIDRDGLPALRLASEQGGTWLIEPDAQKAAVSPQAMAATSTPSDYLLPPALVPADPGVGSADDERASADIVIGYTKGFAARFYEPGGGRESGLKMYLDMLASSINAPLSVSQINARVRIVHTMEVDYPDTTDDLQALRELTGADGATVNPVFAGLRNARDTYGGDAVILVRKYSGPQGGRCGAAWLIGAQLSGVDRGDSALAYSVFDWDLGRYFCTEKSVAHLFGHNLGLQHDRASASPNGSLEYGAFPYAFGYVSAPVSDPNALRTTMAYPVEMPGYVSAFSTPDRPCYGKTCGVRDEADNTRAALKTFPVLTSFRAKKVRGGAVRGDFDMSGSAELYWRNTATQEFAFWRNAEPTAGQGFSMISAYDVADIVDFTGDGRSDILWKSDSYRYLVLWIAKGQGYEQRDIGGYEPGMSFVGVGDFDGDERYDLAWRNYTTGQLKLWMMRGERIAATRISPMPGWFDILGVGDFSDKGKSDIVYADANDVNLYVNDGADFRGIRVASRPTGWTYAASADMDSDGRDDMLWTRETFRMLSYWQMDGHRIVANPVVNHGSGERFGTARHINGYSGAELIWKYPGSGTVEDPPFLRIENPVNRDSIYRAYPRGWEPR